MHLRVALVLLILAVCSSHSALGSNGRQRQEAAAGHVLQELSLSQAAEQRGARSRQLESTASSGTALTDGIEYSSPRREYVYARLLTRSTRHHLISSFGWEPSPAFRGLRE